MEKIIFKITKGEKVLYETDDPLDVIFYENAIQSGKHNHESALMVVEIGKDIYINDQDYTPLGDVADYVSKNLEELIEEQTEKNKHEQVHDFYKARGDY